MKSHYPLHIFLVFYFLIPFVPQNNTLDVVAFQWLLFSFLNFILFIFTFLLKRFDLYKSRKLLLFTFFIFIAFCSLSYTSNYTLGFQDFSRWFQVYLFVVLMLLNLKDVQLNSLFIVRLISFILLFEIAVILYPLIYELIFNGFDIFEATSVNPSAFNGITGNKNIAAASIVVKLPFALYLLSRCKIISLLVSFFIISLSILSILFISSRASYISLTVILILGFLLPFIYSNLFLKSDKVKYLLSLTFSVIFGFFLSSIFIPSASSLVVNKITSISYSQQGSSGRNLLWSDAFSFGIQHPFTGGGLGSWKIESAPYWNSHGSDYLVPYHAHNDFLEIFAELGSLGFLLYLSLFVVMFFTFFYRSRSISHPLNLLYFTFFLSLTAYFIDSFFNFPMERFIMQMMFSVLLLFSFSKSNSLK